VILLDTCILLRLAQGTAIPRTIHEALERTPWAVSALTAWEIAIKYRLGKLPLPTDPVSWWPAAVARYGLTMVPFSDRMALRAAALPGHHADPFDRGIIATALEQGWVVTTVDPMFARYRDVGVQVEDGDVLMA